MPATVTPQQRQVAKREVVRDIERGVSAREARTRSAVPMHRTTVYRLLKRVQREGDNGFADGRHGHPYIVRGEVLTFVIESCQATPHVASSALQRSISERFTSTPSVIQLNRIRARLGLSRQPMLREKKPQATFFLEPGYHEYAGGLLLLAAANETELIAYLAEALPAEQAEGQPPLVGSSAAVRRRLLLTLLFLEAVGLHRTWDLRGYTPDGLALLTGRKQAYSYRYTEAFLSQVAQAGGAERLTDSLAQWTTALWHAGAEDSDGCRSFICYVDGHHKPVYSDVLLPRGLIGRLRE